MKNSLYFKQIGQGQPLVLIHGWGWSSQIWEPLIPQLSHHFELFLIDLPGFGQSPMSTNSYTVESLAPQLLECVPAPAIWLGWSLGGILAWWLAIQHPEKITKLITVAASPRFVRAENWPGVPAATLNKFADSLTSHYEKTMTDFLELQLRGSADYQKLLASLKQQVHINPPAVVALEGGLQLLRTMDLRNELNAVTAPSLHIFGDRDRLVPVEVTKLLPPEQCVIIEKSGHLPFLSQEDIFIKTVMDFSSH